MLHGLWRAVTPGTLGRRGRKERQPQGKAFLRPETAFLSFAFLRQQLFLSFASPGTRGTRRPRARPEPVSPSRNKCGLSLRQHGPNHLGGLWWVWVLRQAAGSWRTRSSSSSRRRAAAVSAPWSMHQTRAVLQHDGPNHLEWWSNQAGPAAAGPAAAAARAAAAVSGRASFAATQHTHSCVHIHGLPARLLARITSGYRG